MRTQTQVSDNASTWREDGAFFEPLFGRLDLDAEGGELLLRHQILGIFEPVDVLHMEVLAQAFQLDCFLHVIEAEQYLIGLDVLPRLDSDGHNRTSGTGGHHGAPLIPDDSNPRGVFIDASKDHISGACHKYSDQ